MTKGIYTYNQLMSPADIAGREILNMNGSLINYIHTGSAAIDKYEKSETPAKKKEKSGFFKGMLCMAGLTAGGFGLFHLFKQGKLDKIKNSITNLFQKIKPNK